MAGVQVPARTLNFSLCLCQSQSQSYFTTDSQSVSTSWCRARFGTFDQRYFFFFFFFFFGKLLSCHLGAPSLTRSRVCHLSVFVTTVYFGMYYLQWIHIEVGEGRSVLEALQSQPQKERLQVHCPLKSFVMCMDTGISLHYTFCYIDSEVSLPSHNPPLLYENCHFKYFSCGRSTEHCSE
jgi:hypothetical protein